MHYPIEERGYLYKIDITIRKIRSVLQRKINEKKINITIDQWVLLDSIYHHKKCTQNEICNYTYKDAPTVARIINLLLKHKVVTRKIDADDKRKYNILLTPKGEKIRNQVFAIVIEVRQLGLKNIGDKEYHQFSTTIDKIYSEFKDEYEA